ncbi:MAG: hypothetical protein FJW91_06135 [Actinobacteria bacterium]|nr:hypothetical protein [Actinomycetota bacterium]
MQNPIEKEFLRREYGISLEFCDDPNKCSPELRIIVSTFPEKWKTYLSKCAITSQTFFLIGNEMYEPDRFEFFNDCSAVSCFFTIRRTNLHIIGVSIVYLEIFWTKAG